MKTSVALVLLPGLILTGCAPTESPPSKTATATASPLPSLVALAESPPPPGGGAAPASPHGRSEPEVPTYEGSNEAERLTGALRDFYTRNGATAPAVTGLETLVKARLLRSVPAPPPGKEYVIDLKTVEVRLENK